MARKQSYFSKSNQGRAGQVLLNNVIASHQKNKRDKQKKAAQEAREEKRKLSEYARHEREVAAEERRQQRDRDRQIREREKAEKEKQKAAKIREKEQAMAIREKEKAAKIRDKELARVNKEKEKKEAYLAMINLLCSKFEIDNLCADEILGEALKADVPKGKLGSLVVEPKIDYWNKRSEDIREAEQLRAAQAERKKYIESVKSYCDGVIVHQNILARFRGALIEEMIISNVSPKEIEYHQSVKKYAQESKAVVNILDQKLDYFCLAS